MARVPVSNRPQVAKYFDFTGATPRIEVFSDASLLISNDLDLQVLFQRSDAAQFGALLCRMNFLGSAYGWNFTLDNAAGRLSYRWAPTGAVASLISTNSGVANAPIALNSPIWLRVTHDVDNGAGGNDVRFYWGAYQGTMAPPTTWTQIGTTQNTAGTTTVFNTTAQGITLGSYGSGVGAPMVAGARIYRGIVRNGIDGPIIVDIDATNIFFLNPAVFVELAGPRGGAFSGGVSVVKTRGAVSGRVSGV